MSIQATVSIEPSRRNNGLNPLGQSPQINQGSNKQNDRQIKKNRVVLQSMNAGLPNSNNGQ